MNTLLAGILMSGAHVITPGPGVCPSPVEIPPALVEKLLSTQTAFTAPAKPDGKTLKLRAVNALTPETPPNYVRLVANQVVQGNVARTLFVSCDMKSYLLYDQEGLAHEEAWYGPLPLPAR